MFKPIFGLRKLMKLICNKLKNEDRHMFSSIKKNLFSFCKNLFDTCLKPKAHINKHQKLYAFWKFYFKPIFVIWNMKINTH